VDVDSERAGGDPPALLGRGDDPLEGVQIGDGDLVVPAGLDAAGREEVAEGAPSLRRVEPDELILVGRALTGARSGEPERQ